MLSRLDDTLHHQVPLTFEQVGTSDHRFYDRYWYGPYAHSGDFMMYVTMGVYKNMNVLDGGACILDTNSGRQHNIRVSRQLRPDLDFMGAGPLRVEVVEPLVSHRMVLEENEVGHRFDLLFEGAAPPHEESQYVNRLDGRLVQDYHRFDQFGEVSGWIEIEGRRVEVPPGTWSCPRDHSWGVRFNHSGGAEPTTSLVGPRQMTRGLHNWMLWRGTDYACWLLIDKGDGVTGDRLDSSLIDLSGPEPRELRLRSVDYELEVGSDQGRVHAGSFVLVDEEGRKRELSVRLLKPPFTTAALGAYGGYNDGLGKGIYRGLLHVEGEVWDVSDPLSGVRDLQGNVVATGMGDGPMCWEEDGATGYGHLSAVVKGDFPRSGSAS